MKKDADYVFYELTRSICPKCRRVIDAKVVLRDNKVYMRKRCPDCGPFEALVYADAQAYTSQARYNKPGTIPLAFNGEVQDGCPYDCGLYPDHQQHTCPGVRPWCASHTSMRPSTSSSSPTRFHIWFPASLSRGSRTAGSTPLACESASRGCARRYSCWRRSAHRSHRSTTPPSSAAC